VGVVPVFFFVPACPPAVAGSVPLAFAGLLLKLMRPGDPFSLTLGTQKKAAIFITALVFLFGIAG
jgi:hypothetical protein